MNEAKKISQNFIDENKLDDLGMNTIGKLIFNIASQNSFYSEVYAEMYKVLMTKYEVMIDIFGNNLNDFILFSGEIINVSNFFSK